MAVERLTDYTRRIWTGLGPDAPQGHDIHVNDVIYYMDSSECCIVTNVYPDGSIDCETLPDIGGGGGGDAAMIDGDYITMYYAVVEIGPNTVTKMTQVTPYLLGLTGYDSTGYIKSWWSIIGHSGSWKQNTVITVEATSVGSSSVYCYRYRDGAIGHIPTSNATYDVHLEPGDRYVVSWLVWKGAPTV